MTYARYTQFSYDPARREEVLEHWRDPETSHPTNEHGFVQGFVFDSVEQPGTLRVVTLWAEPEQFDAYFASPGHQAIGGSMGKRSAEITVRDGLTDVLLLTPPAPAKRDDAGHVRIIRVRSHESCRLVRQNIPGKAGEWCAAETAGCLTKLVGIRVPCSPCLNLDPPMSVGAERAS